MFRSFAVVVSFALLAGPALAAPTVCDQRAKLLEKINGTYHENRVAAALTSEGAMLEIFVNSKSGSWTSIVSSPQGKSCVVAVGSNWEAQPPVIPGQDS